MGVYGEISLFLSDPATVKSELLFFTSVASVAGERFGPSVSAFELKEQHVNAIPKKTRQSNNWATTLWRDWAINRNCRPETAVEPGFPIPIDIGMLRDFELLNYWMERFICEIRRKDGNVYPPATLTQITSALQRHLKNECGLESINFFQDADPTFAGFRRTLDARMKELTAQGVGVKTKKADPITPEDEKKLWDTGVLSTDTAVGLSNAVFFYNGKAFGLRGYQEHVDCKAEQFEILYDHTNKRKYVQYTPRVRKNSQGGLKHKKINIEPIKHYESTDETSTSICKIYETYLNLIPRKGAFYRKPLQGTDENNNLRYSCNTIPQNIIRLTMKTLFQEAEISTEGRNISNHSTRVTLCTTLFNDKFSEKSVKSRSHHRSGCVQGYQHEDFNTLNDVSNALEPPPRRKFKEQDHSAVKQDISSQSNTVKLENSDGEKGKTSSDDECLTLTVPTCVKKLVIWKEGRRIILDILCFNQFANEWWYQGTR